MANVTLSLEEHKALEGRALVAEQRVHELEEELALARCDDPTGRVKASLKIVREMLVLCRFTVANMPPEVYAKWPTEAVKNIAKLLLLQPDVTLDDQSLCADLVLFVQEAERENREHERKAVREETASSR